MPGLGAVDPVADGATLMRTAHDAVEVDLAGELGLSSIDVMEVIEQVEDEFDISFPLNSLSGIHTVSDLAREITRLSTS